MSITMERDCATKYSHSRKYNIFLYLIMFLLIAVESSFYFINVIGGTPRLIICGIIFVSALIFRKDNSVNSKILITAFFLIVWAFLFDCVIAANLVKQSYIIVIHILTGFAVSLFIKKDDFIDKYLNIICFLALFSLVTFIINLLAPQIIYSFPAILSRGEYTYYNLFFSVVTNNDYVVRNYGFFWEPGAFAFFFMHCALSGVAYKKKLKTAAHCVAFGNRFINQIDNGNYSGCFDICHLLCK